MTTTKTTTLWHVSKALLISGFNLIKAHIVDDDCSEYIATIKGDWIHRNWYSPEELQILDCEPYDRDEWNKLDDEADYNHNIIKIR